MSDTEKLLEWGKWFLEWLPLPSSSESRFSQVTAKGKLNDQSKTPVITWEFDLSLKNKRDTLIGSGAIGCDGDFDELVFEGVLIQGRIGVLRYRSKNKQKLLAGSLTIQMDDDGQNISGAYSGFGPKTRGVIHGDLLLSIIS